ncbi:hypothetical protein PVA45_01020 [Entomospira entomophila]|uniref:Uncharacterized protein n=1 Tax=Entomospira entomophila TaxID=2719988 RepID=A0A968G8T6_9SPIO|nr:hypothetical protein [Entomospira entomophilus]NIZ40101.1 hypothetical protein [Entomospira entomophilus]WDI35661.1 hypothetical protein PVA45_01020 [Entomospira entomophilus]
MFYLFKKSALLLSLATLSMSLIGCQTTENSTTETPPTTAPPTQIETKPVESKPLQPRMPTVTVKAKGYQLEVGKTWQSFASLTAGQENVFTVDQYPSLQTTYNGSRVLVTAFVNRLNSTENNYLTDFKKNQSDFTVIETIRETDGYFLIMTRKGDRNSLRYVRLLYHPQLNQALAYNLTFRVIGDELSYRTNHKVDPLAKEILSFFTLI